MEKIIGFVKSFWEIDAARVDWSALFDWKYLTDSVPAQNFFYEKWIYLAAFINVIVAAVGLQLVTKLFYKQKPKYRFLRRLLLLWFFNTILLLLYNFLRIGSVKLLSMRLYLICVILAYFLIVLYGIFYWGLILPSRMAKFRQARLRDRYARRRRGK